MLYTAAFFAVGLLETVLSYFAFSRADDHPYFLGIANNGVKAANTFPQGFLALKVKAAAGSYYFLTTPGRLLGGHELAHLLWLRVLTLLGFLAAFHWCQTIIAPDSPEELLQSNRRRFMLLVLIYPGQLAWTASLLRDGAATAMFFFGLCWLRPDWRLLGATAFLLLSFTLRPEYLLIFLLMGLALLMKRRLARLRWRVSWLLLALLLFSIATYPTQIESATFGQIAFGGTNSAYPLLTSAFDIRGYLLILWQSVIDPLALGNLPHVNVFGVAESVFFLYLLWRSRLLLRHCQPKIVGLAMALIFGLWTFGYFEISVGGFSRHRLSLETALIALLSTAPMEAKRSFFLRTFSIPKGKSPSIAPA